MLRFYQWFWQRIFQQISNIIAKSEDNYMYCSILLWNLNIYINMNIYTHRTNSATVYFFISSFPLNLLDYSSMGNNSKFSKWGKGNITYFPISTRWNWGFDIACFPVFWHSKFLTGLGMKTRSVSMSVSSLDWIC